MNIQPKTWAAAGGAGAAGAFTTIMVWVLKQYAHVDIPPEVQGAIITLITAVGAFSAAYIAPHGTPPTQ